MTQELLYTSAPKGLKPGSRGFCTVVSTQGLPAPLVTALEGLSAYRPVYPHGDSRAADNPVNWSHMLLSAGGRPLHVLSRVADYGLDYSQRSNKLAHHVVLSDAECVAAGPAWVLQQPGVLQAAWDGAVRTLPQGRAIPRGRSGSLRAAAWERATGDAGWAGVVAEALQADPNRQVFIIFSPGMDLLPLVSEVLALLPETLRWKITFSTYCTQLPPNATCQWRCHLADSPEAQQSQRFVKGLRIDLTKPLGEAKGAGLVAAARTGEPTFAANVPVIPSSTDEVVDMEFATVPSAWNSPTPQAAPGGPQPSYRLQPSAGSRPVRMPDLPPELPERKRNRSWKMVSLYSAVAVLLFAVIGGLGWAVYRRELPIAGSDTASNTNASTTESVSSESTQRSTDVGAGHSAVPRSDNQSNALASVVAPQETTPPPTPPPAQPIAEPQLVSPPSVPSAPGQPAPEPPRLPSAPPGDATSVASVTFSPPGSIPSKNPSETPIPVAKSNGPDFVLVYPDLIPSPDGYKWSPEQNALMASPVRSGFQSSKLGSIRVAGTKPPFSFFLNEHPKNELSWCGILLKDEKNVVVFRAAPSEVSARLPSTVPLYDEWSSRDKLGIPFLHFGPHCDVTINDKRLCFRLPSDAGNAKPPIIVRYTLDDPADAASQLGLPLVEIDARLRIDVLAARDGIRIALNPQSDASQLEVKNGLEKRYSALAIRIAGSRKELSPFTTIRTVDTKKYIEDINKVIEAAEGKEEDALERKANEEAEEAKTALTAMKDMLNLIEKFESWTVNADDLFRGMKEARLVSFRGYYKLSGMPDGLSHPEVAIINIGDAVPSSGAEKPAK